ncbi:MAG: DUF6339 family protein [Acidimicrobiales bacterium]
MPDPLGEQERSDWDIHLLEELHRGLPLTRSQAADPGLWHWLTIGPLSRFVWLRWTGTDPQGPPDEIGPALSGRFLGTASLNGVSRNALSRLWWTAEVLVEQGDYSKAHSALRNQDLFQNVFERRLGLCVPVVKACLARFQHEKSASVWRDALKRLNHYATTISLEALDESQVAPLLG